MGELRKRGKVWWVRYYRNGRRFEESARTDNYETARDLLRTKEGDIAKGIPVSPQSGRLRVDEGLADVLRDYRINGKRSIKSVERHVKKLTRFFGGRRMADITVSDIRAYIDTRTGAAAATINRELSALQRAFSLAVDAGTLLSKPKIKKLDENNARQGFFEREQFASVLRHLSPALHAVATCAYYSGWRKGEILGLTWDRVDRTAAIVRLHVGSTKNKDGRTFVYRGLEPFQQMIAQQWAAREAVKAAAAKQGRIDACNYVFHRHGKPIKSYRKAWIAACKAAGVSGRLPHDCRRTAVRNLVRAGVPEKVAMTVTGHKTRAVFDRYNIVSEADLADAAAKLQTLTTGTISGTIGGSAGSVSSAKASA